MKTSILICATCLIVTGCSAQFRFPTLSSALSSLTGLGGSSSGSSSSNNGQSSQSSSPYSGLVRDYGRNLMMAMSNIYPTLFKPPQQQQQQHASPPSPQSPFDQFNAGQQGSQGLLSSQSMPSFSFGGSTFSISPSLPFGSLSGASQPQASGSSNSPFSASFGSSINSPSSFGPLSSAPFLPQSMPSFAPASSYNAAFEAANGGPSSFNGLNSSPGVHSPSGSSMNQPMMAQPSNSNPINTYSSMQSFNGQHDSSSMMNQHPPQQNQQSGSGPHSSGFGAGPHNSQANNQFGTQQYRPDVMSIAASAPIPSSNSYMNYGNMPSSGPSQQAPVAAPSSSSYQQPSYR